MDDSNSESESDFFESAEESLEEEEEESKRKKSGKNENVRNVEIEEPAVRDDSSCSSHQQKERDSTHGPVTYRKRPEKLKHTPKKFRTSVTSQLSLSKTDVTTPDNFFQDITTNLSKNINKSLNTIQQTSSNVKDLIMRSLPVNGANENEMFCYNEANFVSCAVEGDNPLNKTLSQLSLSDVVSDNLEKVEGKEIESLMQQPILNIVEKEIAKSKNENDAFISEEDDEVAKKKLFSYDRKEKINFSEINEFLDMMDDSHQQIKESDTKATEGSILTPKNISKSINTLSSVDKNDTFINSDDNKIQCEKPFQDSSCNVHSVIENKLDIVLNETEKSISSDKPVCNFKSKETEIDNLQPINLKPDKTSVGFEEIQYIDSPQNNNSEECNNSERKSTEIYDLLKKSADVTHKGLQHSSQNKDNALVSLESCQKICDNLPINNINDCTQQKNTETDLLVKDSNWNEPVNDFSGNEVNDNCILKDQKDFSITTEQQKKVIEDSNGNEISTQNEIIEKEEKSLKNICDDQYILMNDQGTNDTNGGWDDFDFSDSESVNSEMNVSISSNKNSQVNCNKNVKSSSDSLPLINLTANETNKMESCVKSEKSGSPKVKVLKGPKSALKREKIKQSMIKESVPQEMPIEFKEKELSNNTISVKEPESTDAPGNKKISNQLQEDADNDWDWNDWNDEEEFSENVNNDDKREASEIGGKLGPEMWSGWDTFGQKQDQKASTWGSWGVNVLLDKATAVTQGISNVLEAGLGAPDPETLARMEKMEKTKQENKNPEITHDINVANSSSDVNLFSAFGITDLVAGVTSKLVEHSKFQEIGSKVISGGLDTLESFGKKTMEVLQEGDPGLRNKRALFLGGNKPVLSQILKEAKDKAEKDVKEVEEKEMERQCHFERLFDDFQGLVHLEALEMLSKQCELKLDQIRSSMSAQDQQDLDGVLEEVEQLCSLDDYDLSLSTNQNTGNFKKTLTTTTEPLKKEISIYKILEVHDHIEQWLQSASQQNLTLMLVQQKLVSTLAQLTAIIVLQYHKAGELLAVKECRKTVEEIDALSGLTHTLILEINNISHNFITLSKNLFKGSDNLSPLINKIDIVTKNSTSYIRQAFNLLIPVLQVGAAV